MKIVDAQRTYKQLIWQDDDRMSGAVCFYGMRIPISCLFEYVEKGETLERFSSDYGIEMDVARQVIHLAAEGLVSYLRRAA